MGTDENAPSRNEQAVCAVICRHRGIRAKEIAKELRLDRQPVNHILYSSPLLKELCWQDRDYAWHGIVRQEYPHTGLQEFCGYYSSVRDFLALPEGAWLEELKHGCINIGRNLNDTRGLFHSFRDCREQMLHLFTDLPEMLGPTCLNWEIVFELRLKRSRFIRIYSDVLVITEKHVFSLEFKMKEHIEPAEVLQAAKYCPYLEILFGQEVEIIPVLVLTGTSELFSFVPFGEEKRLLPVCSGDMLFNVFDEYLGFLK